MTIEDEILEELRKRTPLAEIKRKYRSQSQLYEAIREFLEEIDKTVEEKQERLEKVEGKLLETETELQRINREKGEVSRENEGLQQEKERLAKEVTNQAEKLTRLNADITELQAKGFTSEILQKLKTIQGRSGPELLLQVETIEKYRQVEEEFSNLTKKKDSLNGDIRALEAKKRKIGEWVVSEKNRLDELKLQTATFKEAVTSVYSFFRDGYRTEDIKSLKHGLDVLGIKGDPLLSVTRLVNGLARQKSLIALEERVVVVRKELATLNKALADTNAELNVSKQVTLKAVEEARNAALEAIANTAESADKAMKGTTEKFETHVTESFGKIDAHVQKTMDGVRAGLGEWSELQQKKAKLEEIINPSLVLLGILQSPEYLRKIPLSLVVQLFDRLHLWSEMNLQGETVKPSENIHAKEYNLRTWYTYKLSVLIEFVSEGVKQIMIQRNR